MIDFELLEDKVREKNEKAIGVKEEYFLSEVLKHFNSSRGSFPPERLKRKRRKGRSITTYRDLDSLIKTMGNISSEEILTNSLFSSLELAKITNKKITSVEHWARENELSFVNISQNATNYRFLGSRLIRELREKYSRSIIEREEVAKLVSRDLGITYGKTIQLLRYFPFRMHLGDIGDTEKILEKIKDTEILTPRDVAERLDLSINYVWNCIENGSLDALNLGNRYIILCDVFRNFSENRNPIGRPRAFTPEEEEKIYEKYEETRDLEYTNVFALLAKEHNVSEPTIRKIIRKRRKSFIEAK